MAHGRGGDQPPHGKAQFWWLEDRRVRFSMRARSQNALFRRVRLSSPAQTSACLTEKRILYLPPHGKAHSVSTASRKSTFCTHHDRRVHFSVRTRSQNALFRRVRLSSPAQTSACLTEKHILYPPPHGKAHSVPTTSRKSAFWPDATAGPRPACPSSACRDRVGAGRAATPICPRGAGRTSKTDRP